MVARYEHLGHRVLPPNLRAGVLRILEQTAGETLFREGLGAADHARQQPHTGVDQRDGRRLAARQHEIAEAHLLDRLRLQHTLIYTFEAPADQPHSRHRGKLAHPLLIEPSSAGRQHKEGSTPPAPTIAASSTSGRITMPGPPPNGASSTERCLSPAKSRMSTVSSRHIPALSALPASE